MLNRKSARFSYPAVYLLVSFTLLLFSVATGLPVGAASGSQENIETVSITILGTTDVHGNVWPYDYLRGQPAERGLAKVFSYVKQVRAERENVLLVDSGDTFQGTPLAYYAATKYSDKPNPTVVAMNAMGYDAMAIGNHEFNFGLRALWRMKEQAKFPILGANIVSTYHDGRRDFEPYVIKEIAGPAAGGASVKIALLGLITPAVPNWDPPEHLTGYTFRDPVEVAKEIVPKLRKQADVVVVLIHSGLGASMETGLPDAEGTAENRTYELVKQVAGIDVVFLGHSHRVVNGEFINNAVLMQPKNWAQQVARVDLELIRDGDGWKITKKRPALVGLSQRYAIAAEDASALPPDEEILELTREAHERTERELNTVVARLDRDLDGRTGHIEDHPLVDIIHRAQLEATGADVSLAALFGTFTHWQAGPVTMRDIYSLYFYENKLVAVEITGQQLKDALEHAVERFNSWPWNGTGPFNGPLFNLDFAQGVSYEIDLSRPVGERIVNLRRNGSPLDLGAKLTLAINSYRWSGGGDFGMLRHVKVVKRVDRQVRDMIAEMLLREKTVNATADNNWRIVPDEAAKAVREFVAQPRRR